ncbi:MAG: DMT family transporter [Alphaproteobacteria bacterium]|nr:DMT family transporter [Alphaproteobacteria bacterium]MCB9930063.1 DMT family transporter [Alphaproteobacteria bacterium]
MTTATLSAKREIRPVAAALFMLAACGCFAFNSVFVRLAAEQGTHPFVVAFFRNLFSFLILLPMTVGRSGWGVLIPRRLDLLTLRGTLNGSSMLAWFYAVPLLPLADLTALGFTAPLWATVLAALLLGEAVGWRRWSATLIGFAGVVVIVQPGFADVHWATGLVLFSSAMWAVTIIVVRRLTFIERPETILLYQALMMAGIALVPSLFFWTTPTGEVWIWLVALGVLAATAHTFHVRAYSLQEVAALQPLDFSRLPIIAVAAWAIFDEVPAPAVWIGALIVFAAGTYISHREARLARRGRA